MNMTMKELLHKHHTLEGVKSGELKSIMRRSVTATIVALSQHRLVAAAGDHGCVTVWRDDAGSLRCGFYRYMVAIDEQTFSSLAQVRQWLKVWMPKMRISA